MNPSITNQWRPRLWIRLAVPLAAAAALTAALLPGSGSAVALVPPDNNTEPSINGQAIEGRTLTANAGTWSGTTPMTFTYRWLRCPTDGGAADGSNCLTIGGATSNNYRLRDEDVGLRIRVRVTAQNADGSDSAASNPTGVVQGSSRPNNLTPPSIAGEPVLGETLTADPGLWSGDAADHVRLPVAELQPARRQLPEHLRRQSLARTRLKQTRRRNDSARPGDRTELDRDHVTSRRCPTAVIAASAPTGCPGGNGPVNITQLTPPARLLVDRFQVSPNPIPRSVGALTVGFRVTACGGRPVAGALVYVTAVPYNQFVIPPEQQTGGDGIAILRMDRGRKFPAADNQSLLVMFVRARKGGEPVLAGISTRRLISFRLAK